MRARHACIVDDDVGGAWTLLDGESRPRAVRVRPTMQTDNGDAAAAAAARGLDIVWQPTFLAEEFAGVPPRDRD